MGVSGFMGSLGTEIADARVAHHVRMTCETCGRGMFLPPSKARKQRFCNRKCFNNREAETLAGNIIRAVGGAAEIAAALHLLVPTVRHWFFQGIPLKYHFSIIKLAREKGLDHNVITLDRLLATTVAGRDNRNSKKL